MTRCIKGFFSSVFVVCLLNLGQAFAEESEPKTHVVVKGLFKGAAVLVINGRQSLVKDGQTTDGVTLVSATSKKALVRVNGQTLSLSISQSIGTAYTAAEFHEVRLTSQHRGHFFGTARINGVATQFLVDTGASSVSMSSVTADKVGLKYKRGAVVRVTTAQGVTRGYRVKIRKMAVGPISLDSVDAIVLEGEYPLDVLLGNSFLGKLDMNIESGVLILKSKY